MNWVEYYLTLADAVRIKSKDPSTKVGAVIVGPANQVLSTGFNGFARGIDETISERWDRPIKYSWVEHSERNAIYNAARHGVTLRGSTLYLVGMGPPTVPCTDCARAIIQSGIVKVVARGFKPITDSWKEDLKLASEMLLEAGVEFLEITREAVENG